MQDLKNCEKKGTVVDDAAELATYREEKSMVSKILIDTNVLIDYILEREPFFDDAMRVIFSCIDGSVKGYIAAHSISNMFFILRKDFTIKSVEKYCPIYVLYLKLKG